MGEFQWNSADYWRIVSQPAALLAIPLTVAVHRSKKPFIDAGFNNLPTDGHRWTRMKMGVRSFTHGVKQSQSSNAFIIRDNLFESVVELRFPG